MCKVKASMFNYMCTQRGNCYLYNSYEGVKSICRIKPENVEIVKNILESSDIRYDETDENYLLLESLKERGFLVGIDTDEKAKRNSLYMKYVGAPVLNLIIHTTKNCNFRCQYCYLDFKQDMLEEEMQQRIVSFIKKKLPQYIEIKINWFGGEPLLGMDAIGNISEQVIKLCKRAKKKYAASITTNGYLLTPENVEKLIRWGVYSYTITIDGLKQTHDKLRYLNGHGPTFDKILENLLYIKENIKCSKLRIVIRTNLTTKVAEYLDEYYDFFNQKFGDDPRFSLFVRPVRDVGGTRIQDIRSDLLDAGSVDDIINRISEKGNGIKYNGNYMDLEPAGSTCPAICSGKYTLATDGRVSKCDSAEEKYFIGYINEGGNLIVDGSKEEEWETGCFRFDPKCEDCFFSAACFKGTCPLIWIEKDEKYSCYMRVSEIDSLMQLYAQSHEIAVI